MSSRDNRKPYERESCTLAPWLKLTLIRHREIPCAGCNEDRNLCGGDPKAPPYSLPTPDLDTHARIEAGLREVGSQYVPNPRWQERIWEKIRKDELLGRRRAARNARWLRALWWLGPIVFISVAVLVAWLCARAVRP